MPSLKLRLASTWLPEWFLKEELQRVSDLTTNALSSILTEKAPGFVIPSPLPLKGSIEERRDAMASNHSTLVDSLMGVVGEKETFDLGRPALFKIGLQIGGEARERLGVGESIEDLIMAARVLYKVLGIRFLVQEQSNELKIEIIRCALSKRYSEKTCRVMSATDEGVIRGLNRKVSMKFDRMITSGFPTCIAKISIEGSLSAC